MNSDMFKNIKYSKIRNLYNAMWEGNPIINSNPIVKSNASKEKQSENSFSFEGEDKVAVLIDIFNIPEENRDIFRTKFKMACEGSGQEYRRITTIHSSSLCALLFFYNVTEKNLLKIDGIGVFTKSVFEFKSPVIDENHNSCMDVVLIGKNDNGEDVVLFLESKFSEYYTSVSKKLNNLSERYLSKSENEYGVDLYSDAFLGSLKLNKSKVEDGSFDLCTDDEFYIGGIKQMISHYIGIRNNLNCNFAKQEEKDQEEVIDLIRTGAKVYLAEIIFDAVIGEFKLANGKAYKEAYSEKYEVLATKLNADIQKSDAKNRFMVMPHEFGYTMFLDENQKYKLDENVRLFYFG
jgi:hypothetical protein